MGKLIKYKIDHTVASRQDLTCILSLTFIRIHYLHIIKYVIDNYGKQLINLDVLAVKF